MMSETIWMKTFGNNLIYFMQQAGMTQEELANATGLTQASISRYAAGLQMPGVRAIINLANVLGVSTDDLIDFGDMIEQ
jgi:transcriptional regulator with XRE-family HTH domain